MGQSPSQWGPTSQLTLEGLKKFAYTAWNNSDTLLDSSTSPARIILGEHFRALADLCAGVLQHDKILVRQEYRDILKELETSPLYKRGSYVTGQPGIGKTYFLIYVLIERLRKHKPVAFQPLHSQQYYVLFTDTAAFHSFDDATPLHDAEGVWALTGSGRTAITPADIFQRAGIRIIQTTSPRAQHWEKWSRQYGATRCMMDIWSAKEIAALASLLGLDVKTMSALETQWGGVPQTLLSFYHMSKERIEQEILIAASSAIKSCSTFLPSLEELDVPESDASLIFFVLPEKDRAGHINRGFPPRACIPTPTLINAMGKALGDKALEVKAAFFQAMSAHPGTRRGGNIYGGWLHPFLLNEQRIKCHWDFGGGDSDSISLPATVKTTSNQLSSTEGALRKARKAKRPFYWVAPTVNFPGIDSVLVTEDAVFAIQITIDDMHPSPQDGLDRVQDFLPLTLQNLQWRVLFIGIEEQQITRVSKKWAGHLTVAPGRRKWQTVPVGWCLINPMGHGIVYDQSIVDNAWQHPTEIDEEELDEE